MEQGLPYHNLTSYVNDTTSIVIIVSFFIHFVRSFTIIYNTIFMEQGLDASQHLVLGQVSTSTQPDLYL